MNTNYLRPSKSHLTKKVYDDIEKKENLSISNYHKVTLTPLGQCYVQDDRELRRDASLIFEDTGLYTQISETSAPVQLEGTTIYGGYVHSQWGHFMTESLARMWALSQISHYDHILFFADRDNYNLSGNYAIIFKLLGIYDKIKILREPVTVENLLVPGLGYEHDCFYSDQQAEVYHAITRKALETPCDIEKPEKIFLCRSSKSGATKDGINLRALEDYFRANGYAIVRPDISLIELIHMMNSAKEIATISGTPAHNYAFILRDKAPELYILERHAWINVFQLSLNKMLNLETVNIDAYYLPRLTSSQNPIMLFAPTPQFKEWAKEKGYLHDGEFVDFRRHTRIKELRTFIRRYRRYFCSGDALMWWEIPSGEAIIEALIASRERYNPWLNESLPIMWYDYLTPRAFVRLILRKFFKRAPMK